MKATTFRKPNRLDCYDYSSSGLYFVTICTKSKACILGSITSKPEDEVAQTNLSQIGQALNRALLEIPRVYSSVQLLQYVIMPNHCHLLLLINADCAGNLSRPVELSTVVKNLKGAVTRQTGTTIFQRSFYDHIVRDEEDLQRISEYIKNNPLCWALDRYYQG